MSGDVIRVQGADRLESTLGGAADDVGDLTAVNARVAAAWASRAVALAPKVSGRLAASVAGQGAATGATVTATAPYAGPIHYGWAARSISPNPFILDARDSEGEGIEATYVDELDKIVDRVEGK